MDRSTKRELSEPEMNRIGIPKRFWHLRREDFVDRPYYAEMHDYIVTMPEVMANGRSLFIYGKTGSGKSALAAYIARVYCQYNVGVCFANAGLVQDEVEQRVYDQQDEIIMEKYYREVDLLVIDALGIEAATARRGSHLTRIYEERFNAMRPTIFTCTVEKLTEIDAWNIYPAFLKEKIMYNCILINCGG